MGDSMLQGMMKLFFFVFLFFLAIAAVKDAFHSVFGPSAPVAAASAPPSSAPPPSVPVITPH